MKYEKFLLEENEIPKPPLNYGDGEGLGIVPMNTTKEEQQQYLIQCRIFEAISQTVFNLFQLEDDIEFQTTCFGHSFSLIKKAETEFNNQKVIESQWLSRKKLLNAEITDVSEAVIDLIRGRDSWNNIKYYRTLKM